MCGISNSVIGLLIGLLSPLVSGISIYLSPLSNIIPLLLLAVSLFYTCFCAFFSSGINERQQVRYNAALLGWVFGVGAFICYFSPVHCRPFGWYLMVLSAFHYSEYVTTALISSERASVDSFLINHSVAYTTAAVASWAEFWIECWLFADWKSIVVSYVGIALCLTGETIRKAAMLTAGASFTHIVQDTRRPDHVLVTKGIYSLMRHPSYAGWFLWSVGTQLILCNPVCVVLYAIASWLFFAERVVHEEQLLLRFFGERYRRYQQQVPTGLPAIRGYIC